MDKMKILVIFTIFLMGKFWLSECIDCTATPQNTEARLRKKILCSYDKDVRPVTNSKNATIVNLKMIIQSFDYREYSNMMEVSSWMRMEWNDNHLKWDPAEFDGLNSLTVHSDDIWMPDLTVYNTDSTQFSETCTSSHCELSNVGNVTCVPPCSHSGPCIGEYLNWPFDAQNCSLHFGTWAHRGEEIKFVAEEIVIYSEALRNREWKLMLVKFKNLPGTYSCCPNETYPTTVIDFLVQRHSATEMAFIIAPAIILIFVNLASLWLSPTCTERILLNVLSILSHFLFMQQLSWLVPKNGDIAPKALTFFRDSVIISTILILQTVILRGLLASTMTIPTWIISTTDSLKGNRIGQLMFTNPYLINRGSNIVSEDSSNLVEEQPTTENSHQQKLNNNSNVWLTTVRILDSLMFLAILISYIVLVAGWLPSTSDIEGNIKTAVDTVILPEKQ